MKENKIYKATCRSYSFMMPLTNIILVSATEIRLAFTLAIYILLTKYLVVSTKTLIACALVNELGKGKY